MRKASLSIVGFIIIAALVLAAAFVSGAGDGPSSVSALEATVAPTSAPPVPTQDYPDTSAPAAVPIQGAPAIAARSDAAAGQPAFTAQAVRDYIAAHPFEYQAGQAASVVAVEFLSANEAGARIGGLPVPDDSLVCLATLRGDFSVDSGSGAALAGQHGYLVFDARTGNLLTEAVGP